MKHISTFKFSVKGLVAAVALAALASGCKSETNKPDPQPQLAGTPGNPRFNLQFTNHNEVDLDLYVKTPNGSIIYFGRKTAQGGSLDVDCLCSACPNGPSENIYWVPGSAPSGQYEVWVQYFGNCGSGNNSTSDYTLRVVNGNTVVQTYTGTLSSSNRTSTKYTRSF